MKRYYSLLVLGICAFSSAFSQSDADAVVQKQYQTGGALSAYTASEEVVEMRSRHAKHFRIDDNSYRAYISAGPVHYRDAQGQWATIATDILPESSQSGYGYANLHNDFQTYFGHTSAQMKIRKAGAEVVKIRPAGMVWLDANMNPLQNVAASAITPNVQNDKLAYNNLYPSVSYSLNQRIDALKSAYILQQATVLANAPAGAQWFGFVEEVEFASPNTNFQVLEADAQGNALRLAAGDASWGKLECFDTPVSAYTQAPLTPSQILGKYHFVSQANGKTLVYQLVPAAWILSNERNFPLTIDPLFYPFPTTNASQYVYENLTTFGQSSGEMRIGFDDNTVSNQYFSSAVKFDISAIPAAATICNSTYNMYQNGYVDGGGCKGNIFRVGRIGLDGGGNDVDILTASASAINNLGCDGIQNVEYYRGDMYGNCGGTCSSYTVSTGWKNFPMGALGNADVQSRLSVGDFTIAIDNTQGYDDHCCSGFLCFGNDDDYITFEGYNQTNRPYLDITYFVLPNVSFGNNQWNVYGYNSADIDFGGSVVYRGSYTDANVSINTPARWAVNASPSAATGWFGCTVNNDNHTARYMREGFPCGEYRIDVNAHESDARLYVNGVQIWQATGSSTTPVTGIWQGILDGTSQIELRHLSTTGNSQLNVAFTRLDSWKANAGADLSLCSGDALNLNGAINGGGTAGTAPMCYPGPTTCPVSYTWSSLLLNPNPITLQNVTVPNVTSSGQVILTVSSPTGCISRDTMLVTLRPLPTVTAFNYAPSICSGGQTTIALTPAPSNVAGTVYDWTRDPNPFVTGTSGQSNITGTIQQTLTLGSGVSTPQNVQFSITPKANGCIGATQNVIVTVNPQPSISATPSAATICSGDNIFINLSGTNVNLFNWTRDNTVNIPPSGAYPPSGSTPNNIYQPLVNNTGVAQTTTFTVNATANGCTANTLTIPVTVNPAPIVSLSTPSTTVCSGQNVVLTASGSAGVTYSWYNPTYFPNIGSTYTANLTPGIYQYNVVAVSPNNCKDTSNTITLTVNPTPQATITAVNAQTPGSTNFCDTAILVAGGGIGCVWTPVNPNNGCTFYATQSGTYDVTVYTTSGCPGSASINVNIAPTPNAQIVAGGATIFCDGGNVVLTATPLGSTYQWQKDGVNIPGANAQTYTATQGGDYQVVATNGVCADASNIITVTVNPNPVISVNFTSLTSCDSILVTANGGANAVYTWNPANPVANSNEFTVNQSGIYCATATNPFGCSAQACTPQLTIFPLPDATISVSGSTTVCQGNTVTMSVPAGASAYQWFFNAIPQPAQTPANQFVASAAGVYEVLVTGANGCTATSIPVAVVVNPAPPVSIISSDADLNFCEGETVTLTASPGGSNYNWSPFPGNGNSLTVNAGNFPANGQFQVAVTYPNGCIVNSPVFTLTLNPTPVVSISPVGGQQICDGDNLTMTVSGGSAGYFYSWYENGLYMPGVLGNTYTASQTANYECTVTTPAGCSATTLPVLLEVLPQPNAQIIIGGATYLCPGESVVLSASGGDSYQWIVNGVVSSVIAPAIAVNATGTYGLIATNVCGSDTTDIPVTVTVNTSLVADFIANPSSDFHVQEPIQFIDQSTGAVNWNWQIGDGTTSLLQNPEHTYTIPGVYTVLLTIADAGNCTDTVSMVLNVLPPRELFIPNIFTPNADGAHDNWQIVYGDLENITLRVFDRWGVEVFYTASRNNQWDGRDYSGSYCKEGVYFYLLTANHPGQTQQEERKGNVTLMR